MKQMLEGLTVLDLSTTIACAGAGAMLADYGANVIKIESSEGDPLRKMSPFLEGVSLTHCWFNRGKRSVALGLNKPEDVAVIKTALMPKADVLLEDFPPGFMDSIGLGYAEAAKDNAMLVYCSVTPFGQTGPYRDKPGNDLIVQAMSGVMEITGEKDGPPAKHGSALGDYAGAQSAYASILSALACREDTGEGQYIDVSTMRILIWLNSAIDRFNLGIYSTREGNHHPSLSPFGLFYGKDGQSVIITALNAKIWTNICNVIGHPEYSDDPRFSTVSARTERRFEVVEILETWLKSFDDIQDAIKQLEALSIPCCQVYGTRELLSDPHYTNAEVAWLIQASTPASLQKKGIKTYLTHNTSAKFSKMPGCVGQAPDLGEHTKSVLSEFRL